MSEVTRVFNVLEKVEKESRLLKKKELLESIKDSEVFITIMRIVFSHTTKNYFSYKRLLTFPNGKTQIATFQDFLNLVGMLNSRKIVGKNAENAVRAFLFQCDDFHAKWYRRILAKDLRAGFGVNLLNSLYNRSILDFKLEPMLATSLKSIPNPESFIQQHEWFVEEKIDGLRCLTLFQDGLIFCFSRNGKRLPGAEKFLQQGLSEKVIKKFNNIVLDGEFYSKDWSSTMTRVFTKNINVSRYISTVTYNVFDVIPYSAFKQKKYNTPLSRRKLVLKKIFKYLRKPFRLVPWNTLKEKSLKSVYELSERYIKKGFEGIIIKIQNSPYVCKREKYWIKVKFVKTIDLLCTGVEKSYKNPEEISALIVKYKGKECKVGSGIKLSDRKKFFKNPDLVVGKIIEVEYQEESTDGCLRFPVFIRIRHDKNIPDA